jgi:hypothetical protein
VRETMWWWWDLTAAETPMMRRRQSSSPSDDTSHPIFLLVVVVVCCCSEDGRLDSIEPGRRVGLVAPRAPAASSRRQDAYQLTQWCEKVSEWPV